MNFHFLQEIQFLIVCWKQWVLYCITWVLAYHIYIFWIDACAQNSTNVTYVFVSKKDKKRTYYKCLGKLYNQNFEIRKCQHYCLHHFPDQEKCVEWINCYKHGIPGSSHKGWSLVIWWPPSHYILFHH